MRWCLSSVRLQEEILQKEDAENNLAAFRAVGHSPSSDLNDALVKC